MIDAGVKILFSKLEQTFGLLESLPTREKDAVFLLSNTQRG
jgi:hypothetical protein